MVKFTGVDQLCLKLQPVDVRQLVNFNWPPFWDSVELETFNLCYFLLFNEYLENEVELNRDISDI